MGSYCYFVSELELCFLDDVGSIHFNLVCLAMVTS
jgi:hypothetical protein